VDLRPIHGEEFGCHPERSEGSAVSVRGELMQILRFAQNDTRAEFIARLLGSSLPEACLEIPAREVV